MTVDCNSNEIGDPMDCTYINVKLNQDERIIVFYVYYEILNSVIGGDIPWTSNSLNTMLPVFTNYPWLPEVIAQPFVTEGTIKDV